MAERLDALQRVLEPLRAGGLKPEESQTLGSNTFETVFDSLYIKKKYDLKTNTSPLSSIAWIREDERFVLQDIGADQLFLLNTFRQTEAGINFKDVYLFGAPEVATGGLAHIIHDTSLRERTPQGYITQAKMRGTLRQDDKGPIKRQPTKFNRATFRRSFLTIGILPGTEEII